MGLHQSSGETDRYIKDDYTKSEVSFIGNENK